MSLGTGVLQDCVQSAGVGVGGGAGAGAVVGVGVGMGVGVVVSVAVQLYLGRAWAWGLVLNPGAWCADAHQLCLTPSWKIRGCPVTPYSQKPKAFKNPAPLSRIQGAVASKSA